jgi:hypothetical protein
MLYICPRHRAYLYDDAGGEVVMGDKGTIREMEKNMIKIRELMERDKTKKVKESEEIQIS